MKTYIKTGWFVCSFEDDYARDNQGRGFFRNCNTQQHSWQVNSNSLQNGLNELIDYCDENQYVVKGIIPLDKSEAEAGNYLKEGGVGDSNYGLGAGFGWGITRASGFAAILQREELLSEEEYTEKLYIDRKERLEQKISDIHNEISILEGGMVQIETEEIGVIKKRLSYRVMNRVYKTKEAAETALNLSNKERCESIEFCRNRISLLENKIFNL